jgi:hypothetical protein
MDMIAQNDDPELLEWLSKAKHRAQHDCMRPSKRLSPKVIAAYWFTLGATVGGLLWLVWK